MRQRKWHVLGWCLGVLGLGSIIMWSTSPGRLATVNWYESRWQTTARPHYRYTLRHVSFANANHIYDVRIEVDHDRVVSRVRLDTQTSVDPAIFAEYETIPKVFARVRQFALANPATYRVDYDWETGAPAQITIDFAANTTDDEYTITITDLEFLP